MHYLYYDPGTWEWIPAPTDYRVQAYDRKSWLVLKVGSLSADVVDFEGEQGSAQCTCHDFIYRKSHDLKALKKWEYMTCKHIRLVKLVLQHVDGNRGG